MLDGHIILTTSLHPHAWIDSHYACLVASISMSSMIYELVHFLSKFVVFFLDGIFIHHDHIVDHQLHDSLHILGLRCHIHAIDKPSHYDIILHRGCLDHIHNTFVCTMIAFPPMNDLHLILDHLDKLHALCHEQYCRTDPYLLDGHFVCANHCISGVACVCSFCMSITPETPWSTWIAQCFNSVQLQVRPRQPFPW